MPRHQVVTLYGARGVVVSSYLVQKRSPGFYFIFGLGFPQLSIFGLLHLTQDLFHPCSPFQIDYQHVMIKNQTRVMHPSNKLLNSFFFFMILVINLFFYNQCTHM